MTDGREILTSIIQSTQIMQLYLCTAIDFISTTGLRSVLSEQLQSLDRIESEALQLASQRGWDIFTNRRLIRRILAHLHMSFLKSDSRMSAYLINRHTSFAIEILRTSHNNETYDEQIRNLVQKLLFLNASSIRQIQPFL